MKRKIFSIAAAVIMSMTFLLSPTNKVFAEDFLSLHELSPGGFRNNILPTVPPTERATLQIPVPRTINENYRIFLPPGTYKASMVYYSSIGAMAGTVARAGQPPANNYPDLNSTNFDTVPWVSRLNCLYENLKTADLYTMVSGGTGTVLSDSFPMLTEGEWVYVRPLTVNCSLLDAVTMISVYTTPFLEWYNDRKDNDACWDAKGNPIDCGGTPEPPPDDKTTISGRIFTQATGADAPVVGATVVLVNSLGAEQTTTTSSTGNYEFKDIDTGTYTIKLRSRTGTVTDIMPFKYHENNVHKTVNATTGGQTYPGNIELFVPDQCLLNEPSKATYTAYLYTELPGWDIPIRDPVDITVLDENEDPSGDISYNQDSGEVTISNLDDGNYSMIIEREKYITVETSFTIENKQPRVNNTRYGMKNKAIKDMEEDLDNLTIQLAQTNEELKQAQELCKDCENDTNKDGRIDLGDVIYILQALSGIRPAVFY